MSECNCNGQPLHLWDHESCCVATREQLRSTVEAERDRYRAALEKISHAKADGLDHSIDVGIIERAAKIAKAALSGGKP